MRFQRKFGKGFLKNCQHSSIFSIKRFFFCFWPEFHMNLTDVVPLKKKNPGNTCIAWQTLLLDKLTSAPLETKKSAAISFPACVTVWRSVSPVNIQTISHYHYVCNIHTGWANLKFFSNTYQKQESTYLPSSSQQAIVEITLYMWARVQ